MTTVLFWIFWVIDLLLCALGFVGKGFADSFHPGSNIPWLLILLNACTIGGFLLQVVFKKPVWALTLAGAPLAIMLVWYLVEKATEK